MPVYVFEKDIWYRGDMKVWAKRITWEINCYSSLEKLLEIEFNEHGIALLYSGDLLKDTKPAFSLEGKNNIKERLGGCLKVTKNKLTSGPVLLEHYLPSESPPGRPESGSGLFLPLSRPPSSPSLLGPLGTPLHSQMRGHPPRDNQTCQVSVQGKRYLVVPPG